MNRTKYICYDVPHQCNHFFLTNLECVALKMINDHFPNLYKDFQAYRNAMINRLPNEFIKLISIRNEFVGIVRFEICQCKETKLNVIIIDYIAVREEFRRQRIASLLVYEAIQSIKNVGLIIIYQALEECFQCYKAMGFIKVETLPQRR